MNNNIALGIIVLQIEDAHDAMNAAQHAADNAPMYKMPELKSALHAAQSVHKALCAAYDAIEKESGGESEEEKQIRELQLENKRLTSESKNWQDNYQEARKNNTLLMERAWDAEQSAKAGGERLEELSAEIVQLKALLMITENNLRDAKEQAAHDAEKANELFRSKKAECEVLKEDVSVYLNAVNDLNKILDNCENNRDGLIEDNQEYREENQALGDELRQKDVEIESLKSRCDYLQSTIDAIITPSNNVHPDQLQLPL